MKLSIHPEADAEVTHAARHFELCRAMLGDEFLDAVEVAYEQIELNPTLAGKSDFSTPNVEIRQWYIRRFKYIVQYVLRDEHIDVIAVHHGARLPGYWLNRLADI